MGFANNCTLAIMQPYFFPYWGHFCLIASTQAWVVFDTPQYTPRSWMNRNRILHASEGWQYLTVPLSNSSINISIKDVLLVSRKKSAQALSSKLEHYRKRAPFFNKCMAVFETAFNSVQDDRLVSLNIATLATVCNYLEIPFNYRIASELNLKLPGSLRSGQWAPNIAERLGAHTYINPINGNALFDTSEFSEAGVSLSFLEHDQLSYACNGYEFQTSLSIIDAMMWLSPSKLSEVIHTKYSIRQDNL